MGTQNRATLTLCVALSALLFSSADLRAQQQSVRVAAAADLKFAMEELAKQFENKTGAEAAALLRKSAMEPPLR